MTPGTALDIVGILPKKISATLIDHPCPWCGDRALSGRWHMQCWNTSCQAYTAAPEDIVLHHVGGDVHKAADLIFERTGRESLGTLMLRVERRKVLDFWMEICNEQRTIEEIAMMTRLERDGMSGVVSPTSMVPMGRARMVRLMRLAAATGADYPPSWTDETPPLPALAYIVQSAPHSVDRIMLMYSNGDRSITWRDRFAGISGLLGVRPYDRRPLVWGKDAALRAQLSGSAVGSHVVIASMHTFPKAEHKADMEWTEEDSMFVAVASTAEEVIEMQSALSKFPRMESRMWAATSVEDATAPFMSWPALRRAQLVTSCSGAVDRLPLRAVELFERTGSKRSDAAHLISVFSGAGHPMLVDDVHRLARSRVIFQEGRTHIREDTSEYVSVTAAGVMQIANFTLELVKNVSYPDRGEICHQGVLRIGTDARVVTVSGEATKQTKKLHEELGTQYARGSGTNSELIPTVVDHNLMTRHVLMDMRRVIAKLNTERGVSHLGWSNDRSYFDLPGMTVTSSGTVPNSCIFHPGVHALRVFRKTVDWAELLPGSSPACCGDIISGILAQVVRYYRRAATRPLLISNDSNTIEAVQQLMEYVGQVSVFEMNQNNRENHNTDGVRGYPMLVQGNQQARAAMVGYMLLAADGIRVEHYSRELVDAAGRFLQRALLKTAAWCITHGARGFEETRSMSHNNSLAAEGSQILKLACDVDVESTIKSSTPALEWLFSQITLDQMAARLTLRDGLTLETDVDGVEWDRESVTRELHELDADSAVDGSLLRCSAPVLLPAITRFYGTAPTPRIVEQPMD